MTGTIPPASQRAKIFETLEKGGAEAELLRVGVYCLASSKRVNSSRGLSPTEMRDAVERLHSISYQQIRNAALRGPHDPMTDDLTPPTNSNPPERKCSRACIQSST